MKRNKIIFLISILSFHFTYSQAFKEEILNIAIAKDSLYGTLLTPESVVKPTLIIFIPGSGPTDRNGNQGMLQTNATKYLAEALSDKGFATYRFDQSVITQSKMPDFKEEDYRFTTLVDEVKTVGNYFKQTGNYAKIVLAGHSQGSLVGMLAVSDVADAFISLNGAGQSIDKVLYEQLKKQVPQLEDSFSKTLSELKNGETVTEINPMLYSVFRPSVQPFLRDWMQYEPTEILSKLEIPILIIGGTKDIQVSENDAKMLHEAQINSKLVIIENMNHIFKEIKGDDQENKMSYINPSLPVMPVLVTEIEDFLNNLP